MNNAERVIREYRNSLEEIKKQAEQQLRRAPKGTLHICHDKKKTKYYYSGEDTDYKRKYIRKTEKGRIQALAQKSYIELVLKKIETQLKLIDKFLKKIDFNLIKSIQERMNPERRALIMPLYTEDKDFIQAWLEIPYEGNKYRADEKSILTNNNEMVRSKGEKILADKLKEMGIFYKYECPLEIYGIGKIYPDFTILNIKTRKEVYIELFGMMDNPEYCAKALKKIDDYARAGIYPGEGLICIFESSRKTFDTMVVESILRHITQ